MKKDQKVGIAVAGIATLVIIGLADGGGKAAPASNTSPIASASALASAVGSPVVASAPGPSPTVTAVKAKAKVKVKAKKKVKPRRTVTRPATPAPATSKAAAPPPPTTSPAATPSEPAGCYPLTNGGNCYEPGEYCRDSDHGASGVAGDGERIICEDNDGWRWEPA
jgi:hypothetical protein